MGTRRYTPDNAGHVQDNAARVRDNGRYTPGNVAQTRSNAARVQRTRRGFRERGAGSANVTQVLVKVPRTPETLGCQSPTRQATALNSRDLRSRPRRHPHRHRPGRGRLNLQPAAAKRLVAETVRQLLDLRRDSAQSLVGDGSGP